MADEKKKETKEEAFVRLANSRTQKALDAIAMLRGLANKNNYGYTTEQTGKIVKALESEVVKVAEAFNKGEGEKKEGFSL